MALGSRSGRRLDKEMKCMVYCQLVILLVLEMCTLRIRYESLCVCRIFTMMRF